ncbi:NfeD family protein [Alicyclobacillus sp. TC]
MDGSIWSAICNQPVNMGDIVQVIAIDSVILKVVLFK